MCVGYNTDLFVKLTLALALALSLHPPTHPPTQLRTFDVNDVQSFENIPMWRKEFVHYADVRDAEMFPFVLLGNKVSARVLLVPYPLVEGRGQEGSVSLPSA